MARFVVSVPATSANLGPGYDTLGLALNLRMDVSAQIAERGSVKVVGEGAGLLPENQNNLILATYLDAVGQAKQPVPQLAPAVNNPIPISRGMGSSATAIVAGLALAQLVVNGEIDRQELFVAAAGREGHPDNVAPAVFGGLQICSRDDNGVHATSGLLSPRISVVLAIPEVAADTKAMRKILPQRWPQEDLTFNGYLLKRLLAGLEHGDPEGLLYSKDDRIHQPYRFKANPVSGKIFEIMNTIPGIAGAYLSGSGATVAGWVLDEDDPRPALKAALANVGMHPRLRLVAIDRQGVDVGQ